MVRYLASGVARVGQHQHVREKMRNDPTRFIRLAGDSPAAAGGLMKIKPRALRPGL